ncbi:MAG: hypothetical protein U0R79_08125 [Propionicimonas sp.]
MQRLGHSTVSAALAYQHAAQGSDRIAAQLSVIALAEGKQTPIARYDRICRMQDPSTRAAQCCSAADAVAIRPEGTARRDMMVFVIGDMAPLEY